MPLSIYKYIATQLPSVYSESTLESKRETLRLMILKMHSNSPTLLDTQTSEYFSPTYAQKSQEEREITRLMSWMIEKIFYPISQISTNTTARIAFWGELPKNEEQAKNMFLIQHALRFSLTALGNCSARSSYAAIQLFSIMENTGLQIELISFVEIDHFVLRIKNNKNEYTIYDPLTNPELVFDEDGYNQTIKLLFNPVAVQKRPFNLVVDERVIRQYAFQNTKTNQFLEREREYTTVELLMTDPNYHAFLAEKNISDPEYNKTQKAYKQLCNLLHWEKTPAVQFNT